MQVFAEKPQMPYDENTIPECTWWYDNDGSATCTNLLRYWTVELADFMFWVSILECFLVYTP